MKKLLIVFALLATNATFAQNDSQEEKQNTAITWSGYVEAYYAYDFNIPSHHNRPGFIYSHNRQNEFNLNLGFLKGSYTGEKVRASLALSAGTYMSANYSAEPDVLKNIYEASAGIKLSRNKSLWLDAGIFSSHIGFESAVSKDCPTLTRSMSAESSPYYQAGVKLTFITENEKWLFSGLALNGWQRIKRVDGNSLMSWGTQIQYKPSDKVLLNYSTFIGTDKPDSARLTRAFHNIYGIVGLNDKITLTLGFDIGAEQKTVSGNSTNTWYSPVSILKYTISSKWAIALRGEHYSDKSQVIIATGSANGFQTTGYSVNVDYAPVKNALIRLEGRTLHSKDAIFEKKDGAGNNTTFITFSIAVSLQ